MPRINSQAHPAALSTLLRSLTQSIYRPTVSLASTSKCSPHSVERMRSKIGTRCDRCKSTKTPMRFCVQKNRYGTNLLCVHVGDMVMGHLRQALRHSEA